MKPLARPESWPSGFTPYDIAVSGRHLFVSGMPAGSGGWPTQLLVLTPEGKVRAAARQTIQHKFSFTATPGGHVALCDWEKGRVRLLPNLQAEPPAKGEVKSARGPVAGD